MQFKQPAISNPNHLLGCHPLDLGSIFNEPTFCIIATPLQADLPPKSPQLQTLERILERIERSDLPLKEHVIAYMHHKYRRNCRPNTLRAAATSSMQFLSFYRGCGKQKIEQMTRADIEAFIESLQDRGLKPHSVRGRLCDVYAFVNYLVTEKVLGYELLERKLRLKLPDRLPRAIDPVDLNCLLAVIDDVRDRAIILLLLRTGMRIGELLETKIHDVDLHNQKILIYQAGKTGVGRVVYYSDDARDALLSWLQARDPLKEYLFYGHGRSSLSYEGARTMFRRYLEKADLMHCGYTLHCLRHTFATELLNARMPLECLRVLLGHTCLEVTRIYARLTDATREMEYFCAMERILTGETDADDPCAY